MIPLLLRKALRDFRRMGLRTWLIFLCLAAGVAVFAGGALATASVLNTRDVYCERLKLADLELTFDPQDVSELPDWMLALTRGDEAPLRALGAKAGLMRFVAPGAIEVGGDRPVMSFEVYVDPARKLEVNAVELTQGRWLRPDHPEEVVVEAAAAEINGFKIGQELTLDPYNTSEKVKIVGLARSAEFLLPTANPDILLPSKGSLVVVFRSVEKFTRTFGSPMFNNAVLLFDGHGASGPEKDRVTSRSASLVFRSVIERHAHFSYRFLQENLKAFGIFIPVLAGIFGLVTFLVLLLSISRLIAEEQREIGALMAMGRRPRQIVQAYVLAGGFYGVLASGLGLLLAPTVGARLATGYGVALGLPPILLVTPAAPLVRAFVIGVGATLLSVLLPCRSFTHVRPAMAMRGGVEQAFAGTPRWFEWLVRPLANSMAARFGMRNILRRPRLTFAVVGLIAMAMALSLAFRFAHRAWRDFADSAYAREKWEAIVAFKVPLTEEDAAPILKTAGVDRVETYVSGFASICDTDEPNSRCLDHRIVGMHGNDKLRVFRWAEGGRFYEDDSPKIILNKNFNHERPYHLGEWIWLKNGPRKQRVQVVGLTSDMTIGLGYVPISVARRLLDIPSNTTGFMATFSEPPRTVKKRLFAHEMVNYVSLKLEMREMVYQYLEIIWSILEIAVRIAIVLAALFMLTGLSMAVLERESEYATLRTFGYSRGDVTKMVYAETAVEAGLALFACIPLGMLLGLYLQHAMAKAWFKVEFVYRLSDFVGVLAPALLLLPLAAVPPLVRLLRTPPATALRARSIG
jgi:putative ABC transport system permease protein